MEDLSPRIAEVKSTINRKAQRVDVIIERTADRLIQPGYYQVMEPDYGGVKNIPQFMIYVDREMNLKEIALDLIENKDYLSPWNDLRIQPSNPPQVYTIK